MEKSAAFSSLPPLRVRSFIAGEEELAKALVTSPPRTPPLRISKFEQDHQPALAIGLGLFTFLGVFAMVGFLDGPELTPTFWGILVGFSVLMSTGMAVVARYGRNAPKEVCIDADTGDVRLDGEVVGSLADFYAPRLLTDEWITVRTAITEERTRTRLIYVERVNADPFKLFAYPVTVQLRNRLPAIADHLNALIAEYNYRQDVRRWLEQREAEQAPYRRSEAPA